MRILKMKARFGALSGAELRLSGGFDIVEAPNEGGKSTWCAFIRAMLYGVDSSQRAKAGVLPDKQRCLPWSGGLPEGSMDIEQGGERITLRRASASAASPMKRFSAVYTGTEDAYPLTGTDAGETLLGVGRDVFTRSAFIGQGSVRIDNSPGLEKRISAIAASGDEEPVGYTEADARLREWQRARRYNARVGKNAELEARRNKLAEQLQNIETLSARLEAAEREALAAAGAERLARERLEADTERRAKLDGELSELLSASAKAEEAERRARRALDETRFGSRDPREVALDVARVREQAAKLEAEERQRPSPLKYAVPAALACAALALGLLKMINPIAAAVCCAVLCAAAGYGAVTAARQSRAPRDAGAKRRAMLGGYGVESVKDLEALAQEHARLFAEWTQKAAALREQRAKLEARRAAHTASGGYELRAAADEAALRLRRAREELSRLAGQSSVMGAPAEIREELAAIDSAVAENDAQFHAIELARELLAEADRRQLEQFSPRLRRRATQLFAKLTGGRYGELTLGRELRVSARLEGDTLGHDSAWLSEGARSLLYLALRLAICELALPEDAAAPIVLDDALTNLDDTRCRAVLELLYDLSRERQVILFTCHSREAKMLAGRPGVNIVEEMPA